MDGDKRHQELPHTRQAPYGRHSWEWPYQCSLCGGIQTVFVDVYLSQHEIEATFSTEGNFSGPHPAVSTWDQTTGREGSATGRQRHLTDGDITSAIGRAVELLKREHEWWLDVYTCDVIERLNQVCVELLAGTAPDTLRSDDPSA